MSRWTEKAKTYRSPQVQRKMYKENWFLSDAYPNTEWMMNCPLALCETLGHRVCSQSLCASLCCCKNSLGTKHRCCHCLSLFQAHRRFLALKNNQASFLIFSAIFIQLLQWTNMKTWQQAQARFWCFTCSGACGKWTLQRSIWSTGHRCFSFQFVTTVAEVSDTASTVHLISDTSFSKGNCNWTTSYSCNRWQWLEKCVNLLQQFVWKVVVLFWDLVTMIDKNLLAQVGISDHSPAMQEITPLPPPSIS